MLLRITYGYTWDNFELELRNFLRDDLIQCNVVFWERGLHTVLDLAISAVVRVTVFSVQSDGVILHDSQVYGLFLVPIQAPLIENWVENVGF